MSLNVFNIRLICYSRRIRYALKYHYQSPIDNLGTTFEGSGFIGWRKPYSTNSINRFNDDHYLLRNTCFYFTSLGKKYSFSSQNDAAIEEVKLSVADKELQNITSIFPSPKETLNILQNATEEKVFDVYYKQNHAKVKKKSKSVTNIDWTCTYKVYWPETQKFESTAISKRNAANNAAYQVLNWLYKLKRIDTKGKPIHTQEKLESLQDSLNLPIKLSIPAGCTADINTLMAEYQTSIEPIITTCLKQASELNKMRQFTVHESSLENDDEPTSDDLSAETATKEHIPLHPVYGTTMQTPSQSDLRRCEQQLDSLLRRFKEGEKIWLPIDDYSTELSNTMEDSRVMIVVGEPGCGKSTRAPIYAALEAAGVDAQVIVSEPRRVAALGLADRVAGELGEQVGCTVGYQVRLHSKLPRSPGGSILYCTSGVLLRRLHNNPGLHGCSHVFVDEAHERDVNTDITLLMLKRALELNPKLKLAVMSATLDIDVFTRYFGECPVVKIPGRIFPVETFYLEDLGRELGVSSLVKTEVFSEDAGGRPFVNIAEVAQVVKFIDAKEEEGAILVFLPGWAEILALKTNLEEHFMGTAAHVVIPIHSKLSAVEQQKIFASSPPGVRKIVLATNIAETSVTIPDVVCVVDTGLQREYQMRRGIGVSTLQLCWISRAASKQRAGRAGRVRAGKCYRMYTRRREATFAEHAMPEILRVPLEQTVLNCKSFSEQDSAADFLSQLPEPPSAVAIASAVKDLVKMGALSGELECLTSLGRRLCSFTMHPRLAKALLNAAVLGHARPLANVVTQLSTAIDLFQRSLERKDEIRDIKRSQHPHSDHVALHLIQEGFNQLLVKGGWHNTEQYCAKFGLRRDRLKANRDLANLHLSQVDENELHNDIESVNSHDFMNGLLLSGSDALLCTRQLLRTKGLLKRVREVYTTSGYRAHIGSDSINYKIKNSHQAGGPPSLLVYFGGMMSEGRKALMVSGCSVLSPLAVVLLCEGTPQLCEKVDSASGLPHSVLTIPQHKLEIEIDHGQAKLVLSLRAALWSMVGYYIENGFRTMSESSETEVMNKFRNSLVTLLTEMLKKNESN